MSYLYGVFYEDGTIVVLSPHNEERAKRLADEFKETLTADYATIKRVEIGEWEPVN